MRAKCTFGNRLSQWSSGPTEPPFTQRVAQLAAEADPGAGLIATATLVGRRWGHVPSGWLVGLPLTSGPVVLFLAPIVVIASLLAAIFLMPRIEEVAHAVALPAGDLPVRIVAATLLVVGLTTVAPYLGSYLSGLVSPLPLYAAMLAVFAHRLAGPAAAAAVWRGLLFGLFSFLAFFTVLAAVLVPAGIAPGFLLAAGMTLQGTSLVILRARPAN